jgi:fido (protein-threonine AMPylation protein)
VSPILSGFPLLGLGSVIFQIDIPPLPGASALAGYRSRPSLLRTSRYIPSRWEAVRDAMPRAVRSVGKRARAWRSRRSRTLALRYVHPYPDGNGRIARFLMNLMLASGGYSWTVIRVEDRDTYLAALDRASIDLDIGPFAEFIAGSVQAASNPSERFR